MRNSLHLLLVLLSINLAAQTDDDCATALIGISGVNVGTMVTDNTTGYVEESTYLVTDFGQTISGYTAFTWSGGDGFFSINVTGIATGDWNMSLSQDCDFSTSTSLFQGEIDPALATEVGCLYLEGGVDYIIGYSTDSGNEGNIEFEFINPIAVIPALNAVCSAAEEVGSLGIITTNCVANIISADLMSACPSAEDPMCLELGNGPIFWYTFTTDSYIDELTIETNTGTTITPQFALLTGSCGTFATEGICQDDGMETYSASPNTQYWLAVGEETSGAGGAYSLDITASNIPSNQDCASATLLSDGTPQDGTTICASAPAVTYCGLGGFDHEVYFEYTVGGIENVDLTLSINTNINTSGNAAADLNTEIFTNCGNTLAALSVLSGDVCDPLGGDIVYTCVAPGTYYIGIASTSGMAGDFDITVSQLVTAPFNDSCSSPDNSVALANDCTAVTLSGTNVNACPETIDAVALSCDYLTQSVVWHEITLPIDAIGIEVLNITGGAEITVFADDICAAIPAFFTISNCATSDFTLEPLTGGSSYSIGVTTPLGAEGMYTFDIIAIVPPSNDLCANADPLSDAVAMSGSNSCATADGTVCSLSGLFSHVVWYEYTVTGGVNTSLALTVSAAGGNPLTGVSVQVFDACNGNEINDTNNEDCIAALGNDLEYTCLADGTTIWIAVGSNDTEEGDFDIMVTQEEPAPTNDECDNAELIDLAATPCETLPVAGTNLFACPEGNAFGGCDYDMDPVVWYSVTLPIDAIGLEILDLTPNFYASYFTGGCAGLTIDGTASCFTDAGNSAITYNAGDEILIGIGSTTANEGAFSFNILSVVPPANDMCADAEDISATAAAGVTGTTACASPPNNDYCALNSTSQVVYYSYTVASTAYTNLSIEIAGPGVASDIAIQLYSDCVGTEYTNDMEVDGDDPCAALGTVLDYECVAPGTVITIAVGSPEGAKGEFTITITEDNSGTPANDICAGATEILFDNNCVFETVTTNNTGACPESPILDDISACELDQDAVIWFEAFMPNSGVGFQFGNLDGGEYVAVFSGDCNAPVLEEDCLNADGQILGLTGNTTYFIAVALDAAANGVIEFDIKTITPSLNDLCDPGAETLTSGIVSSGTTACATPNNTVCTLDDNSHVVYYTYVVNSTVNTDLTIVSGSSTATSGNAANDLVIEVWTDCIGIDFAIDPEEGPNAECSDGVDETVTYYCVTPGTVLIIAVGSTDGNDGDFEITVTEDADGIPNVMNDICDSPFFLDVTDPCEWFDFSVSSIDGCPEENELPNNCGFDDFPITWYSFDTPADATTVEINIVSNSAGNTPIYAIFENNCPTLTALTNCETGLGEISAPVAIDPNTTYLIGIGSNDAAGSNLEIQIKISVPPANDDPCDAEQLISGVTTITTNFCATEDFLDPNCSPVQSESSVWYSYTLETGVSGVEISFPSITTAEPLDVYVVTFDAGCMAAPTMASPTAFTCDANMLTDPITLNCLDPGTELFISVSSEAINAGEFEILLETIDPDPLCIDNDECDILGGGADQGVITTDDDCAVILDCNANACPEFLGDCGIEVNNVVWYSVTNDGMGEFISASIENAMFDEPVIAIFDGGCGAALNQIGNCEFGGGGAANAGPFMIPMDGAQYWIAIGSVGVIGDDFELCIEINSGCVNDEPCDGLELMNGVLVDNPASTATCTSDTENPLCGAGESESTVWYTFTVPTGFGAFVVELSNVTITGNVGIQVGDYTDANCASLPVSDVATCEPGDQLLLIPCTPEGTEYYIQITSAEDMDEGDFEITITALLPTFQNDICSGIGPNHTFEITQDDYCMFVTLEVSTEDACPEVFTAAGCDFTVGPAVWMEITIPEDDAIETMDIMGEVLSGFDGNLQIAVLQVDCDDILNGIAIDCVSSGGDIDDFSDIPVTPGETYQILVGSDQVDDIGEINLSIKIDAPPENDNPCPTDINPPTDLSEQLPYVGTTCCARGSNDDPAFDLPNAECSGATDDDAVWFTYTPDLTGLPGESDGFRITITGIGGSDGIMGNTAVEVYSSTDPNGGCTGNLMLVESSCGSIAAPVEIKVSNCDPSLTYYVKIGSAEDDCGDFTIHIVNRNSVCAADDCQDAEILETVTPPVCEVGENILSIEGCIEYACPEDVNVACMNDTAPTVWYQINIDSPNATVLVTQVEAAGFEAQWSIWQSTTGSCFDMINVVQPQPSPDPAIPCGSMGNFVIPIVQDPPGTPATYWIAITALGEITDPNFTLNYAGSLGCIACSGDDAFDCDNGTFTAFVDGEVVEEEDFQNFCPGQEVDVCIQFNYNTAGTGNDWLHGMIPTFGEGWDLESTNFTTTSIGGGWEWVDAQSICATETSIYNLPNLCTYDNEDGVLQLCNTACNPNCPCEGPLSPSSSLPSGWFWSSDGGSTTCVNGSCIPLDNFGVPGGVDVDVFFCILLTIKTFEDEDGDGVPDEDCEENRDLSVVLQTTSDAVTGCWEDNPCIIDPSLSGPDWEIDCDTPPDVIGDDAEICNMGTLDIDVTVEDGTVVEIVVDVIDNPNVDGETDFSFPPGFGTIDNTLTNTSGATEIVIYEVYAVDPTKPCPGITNTIEVTVYPQIEIEFNTPLVVCDGEFIEVIATPIGGTGEGYTYQWGAPGNETDPSILVSPVTTTTYVVTVTDDYGCTGSSEVQVFWNPPVEFELIPSALSVCKNGIEEELLSIDVIFSSGTAPFTINWDATGFGDLDYYLGDNPNSNGILTVYEETSIANTYTVFVEVEDANGCVQSHDIDIQIGGVPFVIIQDIEIPCAGPDVTVLIDAAAFFTVGPPVNMIELYTCPDSNGDDILIFSNFGNSAQWEVDPNIYNCVVVVATDQNGCQARVEVLLEVNTGPEPTLTGASHCIGETSMVSVDDESLYSEFVWNTELPDLVSTITADRDTNFIYVVTVTDAITGCTGVTSYEVLVDDNPNISLSGSLSYCAGGTTTLTASGGDSYSWTQVSDNVEISTMADVLINMPGDYNLQVTNFEGCTSDSTITVIEDQNLLVTLNTLSLCDGDVGILSAGESFDIYQWEDDAGTDLGATFSIDVGGGIYCVTVTDSAAGCTGSTCTTIIPNTSPIVEVTAFVEICREDVGLAPGVILDFNAQVVGGTSGTWVNIDNIGDVNFLDDLNAVDFTGIAMDTFKFEFRTNTAMAPCDEARDTMCVSVINCTCPSVDVLPAPTLCNTAGDMFDLDDLKNTLEEVTYVSNPPNVIPITGSIVDCSGLAAGTYDFTLTLVNPVGGTCPETNTASFIIVEEAVADALDNTVCNADTGNGPTTIDLNSTLTAETTTGGAWTDAAGTPVNNIFDGDGMTPNTTVMFTYTVTGTAPCGDISTEVAITVIDCDCPQVIITDPSAICNDVGMINLDDQIVTTEPGSWVYVSGGTTGTVVLEGGNVFNSNDGTTQLTSGLYIFNYVFDNDPGGDCPSEFPINIILSNQPEVTAIPASPCNIMSDVGSTFVDLTDQISGDIGNGMWTAEPGSEAIDITDPTNVDFEGQVIGDVFEFTFTTAATAPCVPASATVIVTVANCDCPNINVMVPADVCNSETAALDLSTLQDPMIGSGAWTVLDPLGMNVALSGTELSLDGIDAGDYMLIYTLDPVPAINCQPDSTVILSVSAQNFATLGMDQEVCVNDGSNGANFIDFTALIIAGVTDGTWADTDGTGVDFVDLSNVSFEGVDADMAFTFTYTVTSDAPCIDVDYTIVVNTNPCDCPLANPMDPSIECSDIGIVDLTLYNNTLFPGNWSSTELTITANSVDLTDVDAGVYVLMYTMDNPVAGCQDTWDTTIEVSNPASAGTPEEALLFCEDETEIVDLTALLTDEDGVGTWMETSSSTGGAFDPTGTFDITGQASGTYSFTYSIIGDAPCMDVSEMVEVVIEAVPNADAGMDDEIDCIMTEATIGGTSSTGASFMYEWTVTGGATIADPTLAQITVTSAGVYTLVVTNTETMCTNTDMVTITVSDEVPTFEFVVTDITCFGEGDGTLTIINPMGGNGDYSYGISGINGGAFGAETSFTGLQDDEYVITMMDSSGSGCDSEQTATITEPDLLVLDLGSPVQTNLGNEVFFTIEDQLGDFEIDNIVWNIGGVEICSDPTCTSITIEADQNVNINVEVTYNGGCIADAITQVLVSQVVDVVIPNVFSPNNDGTNEVFYINSNDVETVLIMRVYDRWGELVFFSENHPASDPSYGWNGTFKGEPLNPGVFVYVVDVLFINGTTETITGDVTIVK